MPLDDYLVPGEQVKFHSAHGVLYGGKSYQVVLTDRRILLYARRGMVFKNDDIVTQGLSELHGVRYAERGIIGRRGTIRIEGRTRMDLSGSAREVKTLYQQMMRFL